jgi:hypothetical protein
VAEQVGVSPIIPTTVGTQKHRVNNAVNNSDYCSYYRVSIIYPYINDLLSSFNERFKSNSHLITSLSCLLSSKIINSTFQYVKPAIEFYNDDLSIDFYS